MAPSGYKRAELDKPLKIEGKEVWLVPVPDSFVVSKAKILSDHEIEYENQKYSLGPTGLPLFPTQLLLPRDKDSELKAAKNVRIEGLMSLTQTPNLPEPDYQTECQPRKSVPPKTGLKIRHWASGYGPSTNNESNGEEKSKETEEGSPRKQGHTHKKRSKHDEGHHSKKKKKEKK